MEDEVEVPEVVVKTPEDLPDRQEIPDRREGEARLNRSEDFAGKVDRLADQTQNGTVIPSGEVKVITE